MFDKENYKSTRNLQSKLYFMRNLIIWIENQKIRLRTSASTFFVFGSTELLDLISHAAMHMDERRPVI